MDSIPYFVTRPVGEHMMPVYGFSRSYRHALVQHTDAAWYAHSVTINADGIATISTSGRWEYPKWIFEGDNRDAARYPQAFPNMETIAEIDAYNEVQ